MFEGITFHGRLSRRDGRPANPGTYSLRFALHADASTGRSNWQEDQDGVNIGPGGFFSVVLGIVNPLRADHFVTLPRWLSVRVVRRGQPEEENGVRTPLLGETMRLAKINTQYEKRFKILESFREDAVAGPDPSRLATRVDGVDSRLKGIEDARLPNAESVLAELEKRVESLGGDDGRVTWLEDRLGDIDGPDGDIVDLVERMERLEKKAPELFVMLEDEPRREALLRMRISTLEEMLNALGGELEQLRILAGGHKDKALPTPHELGAVDRSGDSMSGALVIQKGGLEVVSGGIQARGANVNTLEAANLVRAPKVITEALELRGELTVDNISRALQVRLIEGRHASGRKDGPLHVNTRSGGDVILGKAGKAGGLLVHGRIRADDVVTKGGDVAEHFVGQDLEPGDVVRLAGSGRRVERTASVADPAVVGVVSTAPGVVLGRDLGRIAVALSGTVPCKVDATHVPVAVGDLLVAAARPGHARALGTLEPRAGTVIGKALAPLSQGVGTVPILVR